MDPAKLVFLDESGVGTARTPTYARAPRSQRALGRVPGGHWKRLTILGALAADGLVAATTVAAATTMQVLLAFVQQVLLPALRARPGRIVVMDNLAPHKAACVREALDAAGIGCRYLPPYSPDLNRDRREIGGATAVGYVRIRSLTEGGCVAWVLRLVEIGAEGEGLCADVMEISRPDSLIDIADLGLTLAEAKLVLAGIQREIVAAQARVHAVRRPACRNCGAACRVKDYRRHEIATLFGQVTVRLPRFCCAGCGTTEAGVAWPPFVRSTPELDRLRPQLSALMTYRTAAALLGQMFPVNAGQDPETLRRHTFKVAETLPMPAALKSATPAEAITLTLDATFIRSCEDSGRHLEVRIGNVETATGRRQVFGAVAKTDTDLATLIRGTLDAVGRTRDTALTALTDGCPGLRRILLEAGITELPILDWFHLAMRLQHLTQVAGNLSSDSPECAAAKAVIIEEVERLRWRLWNGKAQHAGISLERIQAAMPAFQGEPDSRRSVAPSRKLWTVLGALNDYLVGQSDWLVNYAERHRAGLRVGTALTEGTANFLVNRRMAKAQQMRWTRRGADRLLQVRCAAYNGTLGTGFGQRFQAANDPHPPAAIAA